MIPFMLAAPVAAELVKIYLRKTAKHPAAAISQR
jgi:hypothetical protein